MKRRISVVLFFVFLCNFVLVSDLSINAAEQTEQENVVAADTEEKSSGRWMESQWGWWYEREDGTWPVSQWECVDGSWYYFDSWGLVYYGWLEYEGSWYYLGPDGYLFTDCWANLDGRWYYFDEDGTMHTGWLEYEDEWYYFKPAGFMLTGWVYSDGSYYYCDRTTGKLAYNQTVNGIWVDENGIANLTWASASYKIDTMIMADDIVDRYIDPTASTYSQMYSCYKYVEWYPYNQYRPLKPIMDTDYWDAQFARDIFERGQGCCVSEAAALAYLFSELNIGTVYIDHDSGHAWTEVNGRYWDPLFAEAKGEHYLNMSPADYYTNRAPWWREI